MSLIASPILLRSRSLIRILLLHYHTLVPPHSLALPPLSLVVVTLRRQFREFRWRRSRLSSNRANRESFSPLLRCSKTGRRNLRIKSPPFAQKNSRRSWNDDLQRVCCVSMHNPDFSILLLRVPDIVGAQTRSKTPRRHYVIVVAQGRGASSARPVRVQRSGASVNARCLNSPRQRPLVELKNCRR